MAILVIILRFPGIVQRCSAERVSGGFLVQKRIWFVLLVCAVVITIVSCCLFSLVPDITLAAVANALAIEPVEVSKVRLYGVRLILSYPFFIQLFSSARVLVTAALQAGLTDVEAVSSLLPG